jgi:RHS repeat-associated protein
VWSRLTKITWATGKTTTFHYNALGERTKMVHTDPDGVGGTGQPTTRTEYYLYDGPRPIQRRSEGTATNNIDREYFSGGERRWNTGTGSWSNHHYCRDHLGSVREILDSSGTLLARYDYAPYGERTTRYEASGYTSDIGFTGHFHLPSPVSGQSEILLAHYRAYEPVLGRWLSQDPIGEEGGINLYGYCLNSPNLYLDPNGGTPMLFGALIGGIGGAIIGAGASVVSDIWNDRDVDWSKAGRGALKGGVAGAVGGATFGLVAPAAGGAALTAGASRTVLAGTAVVSGMVSGGLGNTAAQVTMMGIGWQDCFDYRELAISGLVGGAWGALGMLREIPFMGMRFAPFGNRVGNPNGTIPHYHRGVPIPKKPSINKEGQGMSRHRPWDTHPTDNSFLDRF